MFATLPWRTCFGVTAGYRSRRGRSHLHRSRGDPAPRPPLTWIAKERRDGRIPYQKFGRHIRYTNDHIAAILKRHDVQVAGDLTKLTRERHAHRPGRSPAVTDTNVTTEMYE